MKSILDEYVERKQNLIQTYDEVIKLQFVPCKKGDIEYKEKDIKEEQNNLNEEKFIITVCSQIKSGKSTLLNYLLFNGKTILPVDESPWTAKLTSISYSKEKKVEIYFYTEEEWMELRELEVMDDRSRIKTNYFDKYLKRDVARVAERGIYDKEFIHKNRYKRELKDFETLKDYISKTGLYTPFVSHVDIATNNEFIKGVTVVDTPGLNDPNELRSRITSDWIKRSNSVIYLFYAGQPLTRSDYVFIDTHLAPIPSKKLVFAISKIDIVSDYERVKKYTGSQFRNDKMLKDRHLLESNELFQISTISAIIKNKVDTPTELNTDEKFRCKEIKDKFPELIDNGGYLNDFIKGIEKNIMQDKGAAIIDKHENQILLICKTKTVEINLEIDSKKDAKRNLELTQDEREKKKNEIKNIRDKVGKIMEKFNTNINKKLANICNKIRGIIKEESCAKIKEEIDNWIENCTITEIVYQATHELKDLMRKNVTKNINSSSLYKNLEENLADMFTSVKQEIKGLVHDLFSCNTAFIFNPVISLKDVHKIIDDRISELMPERLEKHRKRVWKILWTDKDVTKNRLSNEIKDSVDGITGEICETVDNVIKKEIRKPTEDFEKDILDILNNYDARLGKINKDSKHESKNISEIEREIKGLESTLKKFEENFYLIKEKVKKGTIT